MTMSKNLVEISILITFASAILAVPPAKQAAYDYPDYEYTDDPPRPICDENNCKLPNCSCFNTVPNILIRERPQFVMLTFDDAITVANIDTYKRIITRKNRDGSSIRMTFFVCHEYNDYTLTNELQSQGHEIAVHSVSHESNTDLWRHATDDKWKKEMSGVRLMLSKFGGIPNDEIVGHRAPFLQTAGDNTFKVLQKEGFLYDSSMPSRNYMDPPVWPYTLDYGFAQDCQIEPCPEEQYKGVWEIPMIQYHQPSSEGDFYCSMADACTPYPKTAAQTKDYFLRNFNRHYLSNKAPFPVFLHEGWLRDKPRFDGYLQFLDEILSKQDVYLVTMREVVEYMKNPVPHTRLTARSHQRPASCSKKEVCSYKNPLRIMKSCSPCPKFYPWVGTPLGGRPPIDFNT